MRVAVAFVAFVAAAVPYAPVGWPVVSSPVTIALCPGLTIVTALSQPAGDYESIKRVESATASAVTFRYSAQIPIRGGVRHLNVTRTVLRKDLETATLYLHYFGQNAPVTIPGSTAIGTSTAVLRALKTMGAAELGLVERGNSEFKADRSVHPNVYDFRVSYTLRRVGTTVTVPVMVDGTKSELPAVQARGEYMGDIADFFFLDDDANPIALKYRFTTMTAQEVNSEALALQVVKINRRCTGPAITASTSRVDRIERSLLETGRVDVYDIYFDFNDARIREESEPTLREIAEVLTRHPDWKLSIEGHTDGIGTDAANLELSNRRAASVKTALATAHHVDAGRLSTAGFGESRPKDSNDTLEGRARNRRVELVRRP